MMDDIDKKKRRKKKRNKQNKTEDQNGASSDNNEAHKLTDESRNGDLDGCDRNGTDISMLTEAEKQQWLQREAILKGTIRKLQHDNDLHIEKEAIFEEKVKLLQAQNDSDRQKQAALEETINQLRHTNYLITQNEVTLKETLQQLKNEKDKHIQKEAVLEKKIFQLQSEKESLLRKEAILEEKLQKVVSEKALLDVKVENMEEKIKLLESDRDSLALKEAAAKETIAALNSNITKSRMQVVELEESRENLTKENQQLMENLSGLQLQLQNLETRTASTSTSVHPKKHVSELEDKDSEIEAACALVDKLITENAELIEKVNELYNKLDRQRSGGGLSSLVGSSSSDIVETSESVSAPESSEYAVEQAFTEEPELEIVQISLDDRSIPTPDLELQNDDKVPLSEAPLTGAPLRLISFFAKYVSGADLVDKN